MKNVKLFFAAFFMFAMFSFTAEAQQRANVGQALRGLINVNIGAIQADVELDNVLNDFTLVNVEDVLNDANIEILNNALNNNEVASRNQDFLNDLLRDANIITDNQVVVGVLSGGILLIQDLP